MKSLDKIIKEIKKDILAHHAVERKRVEKTAAKIRDTSLEAGIKSRKKVVESTLKQGEPGEPRKEES